MKTKTQLNLFLAMLLFGFTLFKSYAQISTVSDLVTNKKSYWQLSSRVGYDFPMFTEDFKYIDYKGGLMGGLSVNRYWNHWGIEADFDYIQNSPFTTLRDIEYYYTPGPVSNQVSPIDVTTKKTNLNRMFIGIGPAYKWQSVNDKLTIELAAMGGLGFINGGEILVEGSNKNLNPSTGILTYHSGFDHEQAITFKTQARATYWFKGDKWGINGGVYYMNHFGVNESKKNQLLIDNGYITSNNTGGVYFMEAPTFSNSQINNGEEVFGGEGHYIVRGYETGTDFDERHKIKLASVGAFIGLSYRFLPHKKAIIKEEPVVVEEKIKEPVIEKYCIQVTAKDKYTNELLPNTDVALKNSKGVIVGSSKTDAFGVTKFCDILPDDYSLAGVLNDVPLEGNVAQKSEFNNGATVLKDIKYSDRNFIVKGKAVECNTTTPIPSINVVLENKEKAFKKTTLTQANGTFLLSLPEEGTYSLYGKKDSYFSQTEIITASNYDRSKTLFVKLEICAEKADCGKAIELKNILFDLAKYNIKEDAKVELNKLVRFMQDNPDVKVELGSHTDCRSSSNYNQTLSQNRANASVDYVVSQGISRERISGKGYGETKLLNECADGVKCSEEQHSINRRTEMKVVCPK